MSKNRELRKFADSVIRRPESPTGSSLRTLSGNTWRLELLEVNPPFQIERVILASNIVVKTHRHPNVDSYEVYVAGSGTISIGRKSYFVNDQLSRELRMLPIPRMVWHGGTINSDGAVFLSIQYWYCPITSVAEDWEGQPGEEEKTEKVITAQQIIDEARTWIGTPYQHQGRTKGRAVDCVGLMAGIVFALGLRARSEDVVDYNEQPNPEMMGRLLDKYATRIPVSEMRPGDVLWLRYLQPQHVALFTEKNTIIHVDGMAAPKKAHDPIGRCVEHGLNDKWRRRIVRIYRIPGVEP